MTRAWARAAAGGLLIAPLVACAGNDAPARDLDAHPLELSSPRDPELGPGEALVRGFLRDAATRKPIPDASVLLRSDGRGLATSQQSAVTDKRGRFTVVVPADRYQAFSERCGYKPQVAELDAHGAAPVDLVLFLEPGGEACPR